MNVYVVGTARLEPSGRGSSCPEKETRPYAYAPNTAWYNKLPSFVWQVLLHVLSKTPYV